MATKRDPNTDLPVEQHQAPADIPKANPNIPLGSGVEVNGELITEAKIKFVGGMSPAEIKNPASPGELRAYIVLARAKKHHVDKINDEPRLVVDMEPYVIYDRDLGPFGDQTERGPDEKVVVTDPNQTSIDDLPDDDTEKAEDLGDYDPAADGYQPDGPEFSS